MMNTSTMVRIAASSLLLGATMVGCMTSSIEARSANASDTAQVARFAAKAADKAERALTKKDSATAVTQAEMAVDAMPRYAAYRTLLGRSYLAAGRFASAETTFADALSLDAGQARAAVSLALAQIAQGKAALARETIDTHQAVISPADRGLALALAGDPQGAVQLLEATVRATGGDARVRQNLALSYALSGRWNEAKLLASYDVAPALVSQRIMDWARFARPSAASDQVASLLGVTPAMDPGQPTRLALAPLPSGQAYAAAAPVIVPAAPQAPAAAPLVAIQAPAPAPAIVHAPRVAAAPTQAPVAAPAAAPVDFPIEFATFSGVQFGPRKEIVQPLPRVARAPVQQQAAKAASPRLPDVTGHAPMIRAAATPMRVAAPAARFQQANFSVPATGSNFVVQLGAYSSAERVETAWKTVSSRFGEIAGYTPSSATYLSATREGTLHRLSIAGFANRADATAVCGRIKARGGACFVRAVAGDAPLQWAQRKVPTQLASR